MAPTRLLPTGLTTSCSHGRLHVVGHIKKKKKKKNDMVAHTQRDSHPHTVSSFLCTRPQVLDLQAALTQQSALQLQLRAADAQLEGLQPLPARLAAAEAARDRWVRGRPRPVTVLLSALPRPSWVCSRRFRRLVSLDRALAFGWFGCRGLGEVL